MHIKTLTIQGQSDVVPGARSFVPAKRPIAALTGFKSYRDVIAIEPFSCVAWSWQGQREAVLMRGLRMGSQPRA